MIKCPSCHSLDLKGSQLVEMGVTTVYDITNNASSSSRGTYTRTKTRVSQVQNEDSSLVLICGRCGVESELDRSTSFDVVKR